MQRLRPLMFVFPPFDFLEDERIQEELLAGGVSDLLFTWGKLSDERPHRSLRHLCPEHHLRRRLEGDHRVHRRLRRAVI